ncbi:putative phospholipase D [Yersinia aldovae]|uniref:phospholipase D family nuclease n=1 Tax=Yersinia aldovae TaxID=29483 RepID=UPI0005E04730|nr:phospholipase D family protein [Yersinia aldovae]CNK26241.1 putative phospholipase D [Yersinia aldovae]
MKKLWFIPLAALAVIYLVDLGSGTSNLETLNSGAASAVKTASNITHKAIETPLVGFSPDGKALDLIIYGITKAKVSIDVAAYSFTNKSIAAALVAAQKRGVSIRVVADSKANADRYTAVTFLINNGIPVVLSSSYKIMHNKYMIFDGLSVQTGSFNYTASAVTNAENVILLRNMPDVAKAYQKDFDRLYLESME